MLSKLTISVVQQPCKQSHQINYQILAEQIKQAALQKADLVILPELHNGPYFCQHEDTRHFDLAESIPGPTTNQFAHLAQQFGLVIVISIFERRAAGIYHNTAVVLDKDGQIAGKYRKMHIPDDPGFYEKFYFTPGDMGFKPIQTSIGSLGVMVCWDQWFPEAARLMTLAGAQLLIYPSAIGWDPKESAKEKQRQLESWMTIQRAHAIANGIPIVACNRIGFEAAPDTHSGIEFWGNSFIAGPQGEILKQANSTESELLTYTINHKKSELTRQIWPFLRDRRIDFYGDLNKRLIDD